MVNNFASTFFFRNTPIRKAANQTKIAMKSILLVTVEYVLVNTLLMLYAYRLDTNDFYTNSIIYYSIIMILEACLFRVKSKSINILIATCSDGKLRCDNSKCVTFSNRCDGNNDCGDNSDEKDCDLGW